MRADDDRDIVAFLKKSHELKKRLDEIERELTEAYGLKKAGKRGEKAEPGEREVKG